MTATRHVTRNPISYPLSCRTRTRRKTATTDALGHLQMQKLVVWWWSSTTPSYRLAMGIVHIIYGRNKFEAVFVPGLLSCPILSSVQQDKNYLHSGGHALGMPINILWSLLLVQVLYCNFINLSVGWKGGGGRMLWSVCSAKTHIDLRHIPDPKLSPPAVIQWPNNIHGRPLIAFTGKRRLFVPHHLAN